MSAQSSGPASRVISSKRQGGSTVDSSSLPERSPRQKRVTTTKPRKQKKPLAERLPAGAFEDRPRQRKYILHWMYFWMWARLGLYKTKVPAPRPSIRELRDRGFDRLFELADNRQPIIACVNSKGGAGKSVMATWLGVLITLATQRSGCIVDANENKGSTANRLGIDRDHTVKLRDFLQFEKELRTASQFTNALAAHKGSGLMVIASDPDKKSHFSQQLFERRIRTLNDCFAAVVLDAGNGIPHAANRGSVAVATTLVFPATVKQADSFEDARDTQAHYASSEVHYGFGTKVREGIIPLLGVSESERQRYIELYGWNPAKVFCVPEDKFMVGKHIVTWSRIRPRTQLALVNIAVAIYEATPLMEPWKAHVDASQHRDELSLPDPEDQLTHNSTERR